MKDYPTDKIRNLVLLGHGGTGKTSLAEAALFVSGAINRLGKVEDGTTTSDFDPDEVKRKVSINASLLPVRVEGPQDQHHRRAGLRRLHRRRLQRPGGGGHGA